MELILVIEYPVPWGWFPHPHPGIIGVRAVQKPVSVKVTD
jgi:hypothetical protein